MGERREDIIELDEAWDGGADTLRSRVPDFLDKFLGRPAFGIGDWCLDHASCIIRGNGPGRLVEVRGLSIYQLNSEGFKRLRGIPGVVFYERSEQGIPATTFDVCVPETEFEMVLAN